MSILWLEWIWKLTCKSSHPQKLIPPAATGVHAGVTASGVKDILEQRTVTEWWFFKGWDCNM